jgi:NAD(P)-dependent dehydrogenase (short-subunit alcohol dehydrogenase family)
VVTVDAADLARALAQEGAIVVIVAATPETSAPAGALAREIEGVGARTAVFMDDPATDEGRAALIEMLSELFDRDG